MSENLHPLRKWLAENNETLTAFSERVGMTRQNIDRVMGGANTTLETLRKLSQATGGKVTVSQFVTFTDKQPKKAG